MPRYAYQKPRAKVYAYNYGYMNNYYRPMTHYLNRETPAPADRPGPQSLAERLKKFPMDGSIYPDKDTGYRPSLSPVREVEMQVAPDVPSLDAVSGEPVPVPVPVPQPSRVVITRYPPTTVVEEERPVPLYMKHPYRLPVEDEKWGPYFDRIWFRHPWDWECIWVPPHETHTTPHFGVESAYDLITRFLRLRHT